MRDVHCAWCYGTGLVSGPDGDIDCDVCLGEGRILVILRHELEEALDTDSVDEVRKRLKLRPRNHWLSPEKTSSAD